MNVSVKVSYVRTAVALVSGGKDSVYALHVSLLQGFDVRLCATLVPPGDAMLFHRPNVRWAHVVCDLLGIPHVYVDVEEEEGGLEEFLSSVDEEYIIVGATASEYQRMRFNFAAERAGKKVHAPLWHVDPAFLLRSMVAEGFRFIVVFSGAEGLDAWLGKEIGPENVDSFIAFARRARINPAGEGGEYESLVVATPEGRLEYSGHVEGRTFVVTELKRSLHP